MARRAASASCPPCACAHDSRSDNRRSACGACCVRRAARVHGGPRGDGSRHPPGDRRPQDGERGEPLGNLRRRSHALRRPVVDPGGRGRQRCVVVVAGGSDRRARGDAGRGAGRRRDQASRDRRDPAFRRLEGRDVRLHRRRGAGPGTSSGSACRRPPDARPGRSRRSGRVASVVGGRSRREPHALTSAGLRQSDIRHLSRVLGRKARRADGCLDPARRRRHACGARSHGGHRGSGR